MFISWRIGRTSKGHLRDLVGGSMHGWTLDWYFRRRVAWWRRIGVTVPRSLAEPRVLLLKVLLLAWES
jgi:hypothetical protein